MIKKHQKQNNYYHNVEVKHEQGAKQTRRVYIKGGKGHISITERRKNKNYKVKQTLKKHEIKAICERKFIPGLWNSCKAKLNKNT